MKYQIMKRMKKPAARPVKNVPAPAMAKVI